MNSKPKKEMSLEELLAYCKDHRCEGGEFGIAECKNHIYWRHSYCHSDFFAQLREYYKRATTDSFFNDMMVLACWEIINEKKGEV